MKDSCGSVLAIVSHAAGTQSKAHTFLCTLSFRKISVASSRWVFSTILVRLVSYSSKHRVYCRGHGPPRTS